MKKIILIMITLLSPIYVACGDNTITFVNDTEDVYSVMPFNGAYPEVVLSPGEQRAFVCPPPYGTFYIHKANAYWIHDFYATTQCNQETITIGDLLYQLRRSGYN